MPLLELPSLSLYSHRKVFCLLCELVHCISHNPRKLSRPVSFSCSDHDRNVNQTDMISISTLPATLVTLKSPCLAFSTCFLQTVCSTVQAQLLNMHYSNTVASDLIWLRLRFAKSFNHFCHRELTSRLTRKVRQQESSMGTQLKHDYQCPSTQSRHGFFLKLCFDHGGMGQSRTEMDARCGAALLKSHLSVFMPSYGL